MSVAVTALLVLFFCLILVCFKLVLLRCNRLYDQRLPVLLRSQVGVVSDRLVSFQVWPVLFYSLSWSHVQILDHDRPATASSQDRNSISDKTGSDYDKV